MQQALFDETPGIRDAILHIVRQWPGIHPVNTVHAKLQQFDRAEVDHALDTLKRSKSIVFTRHVAEWRVKATFNDGDLPPWRRSQLGLNAFGICVTLPDGRKELCK